MRCELLDIYFLNKVLIAFCGVLLFVSENWHCSCYIRADKRTKNPISGQKLVNWKTTNSLEYCGQYWDLSRQEQKSHLHGTWYLQHVGHWNLTHSLYKSRPVPFWPCCLWWDCLWPGPCVGLKQRIGDLHGKYNYRPPCKIAFSPNLCVIVRILSSEYQVYACGKIFPMPWYWTKMLIFQGTL